MKKIMRNCRLTVNMLTGLAMAAPCRKDEDGLGTEKEVIPETVLPLEGAAQGEKDRYSKGIEGLVQGVKGVMLT